MCNYVYVYIYIYVYITYVVYYMIAGSSYNISQYQLYYIIVCMIMYYTIV